MSSPPASLAPSLSALRISLHVLAATVWVGGQITIAGLLGTLRRLDDGAPRTVARAFARIEWPAYFLLVATGIWNAVADNPGRATNAWKAVLGTEIGVALLAGACAWLHQRARSRKALATFGALAGILSLLALVLGVLLGG